MKKLGASLVVFLATVLALLSICTACYLWLYQPELPQKPQK
ncbi:MAG TPA: cyclic lactone autoinducer peptide [Bacillota bacterium]|nr:cyclic lactone autoinducer peptide [Bacillota bacterium]